MSSDLSYKLNEIIKEPKSLFLPPDIPEKYNHDETEFSAKPDALLIAANIEDIITTVKYCALHQISITARGAGTGLSGGCVPSKNALLISVEKLCSLEIIPDRKIAICEPGVITKEIIDRAAKFDLTYPPDPASFEESTIAGNVAEGAGGLRCKRFGVTRDYVIGLEAVLADGSLLKTGLFQTVNPSKGFSLGDLLISSEGTLAIITRIALRLIDLPKRGDTILVAFSKPQDAAQTVTDITTSGIIPTVLEFLDGDAADCSNRYEKTEGLDRVAGILLIECSANKGENQSEEITKICQQNHASYLKVESNPESAHELWRVRRNLSKAISDISGYRVSEDIAVPNSKFPILVDFVAELNKESYLRVNSFGHAGDGNLHVNFLAETDNRKNRKEVEKCIMLLIKKTLALGGTLTGEHGIGLAKKQFINLEFDTATMKIMRDIKETFDPNGIFNPDKLLPINY